MPPRTARTRPEPDQVRPNADSARNAPPPSRRRIVLIGTVLMAQVLALAIGYQFVIDIDCAATGQFTLCRSLRGMLARAIALAAGLGLLVLARPGAFVRFAAAAGQRDAGTRRALALNLAGMAILLAPMALLADGTDPARFRIAVAIWLLGGLIAVAASLRWIAPWPVWRRLLADLGWPVLPVLALVLTVPELAQLIQPLWDASALTLLTFALVYRVLWLTGDDAFALPDAYIVGVGDFAVHIARQCSGVEGFVLVGSFVAVYALLFHRTVRLLRFGLLVLPVALLLSWLLNILRIALLVWLGAHVSPALAVDGFHSYAGWLFFTLLAMAILLVVHASPSLHHSGARAPGTPLRADPAAARLLPFIAFMVSGIVAGAFFAPPEAGYPLRVAIMLAALMPFWAQYAALDWRLDPVPLALGALVGLGWVAAQGGASESGAELAAMLGGMSAAGAVLWMGLRVLGTVALVPLIEELFFRGYLLTRLDRGGVAWRLVAVAVSTGAFALLHGRWLEAGLAGLVFAWAYLRRERVADAVLAHLAANAVVAAAALMRGDWGLI